jgi:diguanylate cyclase (GGDEF)-like protein
MRETTALLGLALDGAPGAVDAAQAVVDHLAAEDRLVPAVYLARAGRLRRVASSGQWVAEDGIAPGTGAVGRAYRTGSEVVGAPASGGEGSEVVGAPASGGEGSEVVGAPASGGEGSEVVQAAAAGGDGGQAAAVDGAGNDAPARTACLPIFVAGRPAGVLEIRSNEPLTAEDLEHARACAAALGRRIEAHSDMPADDGARRLLRHLVDMGALEDGHAIAGALLGAALDLVALQSAVLVRTTTAGTRPATAVGPLADVLRATRYEPIVARVRGGSSCATSAAFEAMAPADLGELRAAGIESLAAVGLHAQGDLIGVLVLASADRAPLHTDDVELLEQLAAHAACCLRASERLQSLRDRAASDPLTGLGHHATFHEALAASHRRPRTAVVVCDLDGFKRLNDTHGHAHGDRVLCGVADAMTGALRRGDRLFRVGGDEFAALVAVGSDAEALDAATRLHDAVTAAQLGVTVSAGVAVPRDGEADASLLARADRALYAVKASDRDDVALAQDAPAPTRSQD